MSNQLLNLNNLTDSNIWDHYALMSKKLLMYGYKLINVDNSNSHILCTFSSISGGLYYSIYIKERFRNRGLFSKLSKDKYLITLKECGLEEFFKNKNVKFYCPTLDDQSYLDIIEHYYNNKRAKRSNIPYINHIYEGCGLLKLISADVDTISAFIVHPIYQNGGSLPTVNPDVEFLANLYSTVANRFLRSNYKSGNKRHLTVLDQYNELRQILVADKVQNYKDALANKDNLEEWEDIENYFLWWFDVLGITHSDLKKYLDYINDKLWKELKLYDGKVGY